MGKPIIKNNHESCLLFKKYIYYFKSYNITFHKCFKTRKIVRMLDEKSTCLNVILSNLIQARTRVAATLFEVAATLISHPSLLRVSIKMVALKLLGIDLQNYAKTLLYQITTILTNTKSSASKICHHTLTSQCYQFSAMLLNRRPRSMDHPPTGSCRWRPHRRVGSSRSLSGAQTEPKWLRCGSIGSSLHEPGLGFLWPPASLLHFTIWVSL